MNRYKFTYADLELIKYELLKYYSHLISLDIVDDTSKYVNKDPERLTGIHRSQFDTRVSATDIAIRMISNAKECLFSDTHDVYQFSENNVRFICMIACNNLYKLFELRKVNDETVTSADE